MEDWLIYHEFPIIGEINGKNSKRYIGIGIPLVFIFVETEKQRQDIKSSFQDLARHTKTKLNWVFVDWKKYGNQAKKLGLSGTTVPAFVIEDTKKRLHYAFDETKTPSTNNIQKWIEAFVSQTLPPTLVSAPRPEKNDGPVKIVVADTFEEIVLDTSRDVFLMVYAPWCGHCKKLTPKWEELALRLQNNQKFVIAKIDGTVNDIHPKYGEFSAYPTLLFFPSSNKNHPITYSNSERTVEAFMTFLSENAR